MAKLRMAHASTHGARKPPGPKSLITKMFLGPSATVATLCLVTVLSNTQENSPFFTLMKGTLPRMGIIGGPGGRFFPFFLHKKKTKVRKSKASKIPTILYMKFSKLTTI